MTPVRFPSAIPALALLLAAAPAAESATPAPAPSVKVTTKGRNLAQSIISLTQEAVGHFKAIDAALRGVKDKAGADAAAAEVAAHTKALQKTSSRLEGMSGQIDAREAEIMQVFEEDDTWGCIMDENDAALDSVFRRMSTLAARTPAFYGSESLEKAVGDFCALMDVDLGIETDEEVPPAMKQKLQEVRLQMFALDQEFVGICRTVTDKASADAAAPLIRDSARKQRAIWNGLSDAEAAAFFRMDPEDFFEDRATCRAYFETNNEAMTFCLRMEEMDPPYYGSEALRKALHEAVGMPE